MGVGLARVQLDVMGWSVPSGALYPKGAQTPHLGCSGGFLNYSLGLEGDCSRKLSLILIVPHSCLPGQVSPSQLGCPGNRNNHRCGSRRTERCGPFPGADADRAPHRYHLCPSEAPRLNKAKEAELAQPRARSAPELTAGTTPRCRAPRGPPVGLGAARGALTTRRAETPRCPRGAELVPTTEKSSDG